MAFTLGCTKLPFETRVRWCPAAYSAYLLNVVHLARSMASLCTAMCSGMTPDSRYSHFALILLAGPSYRSDGGRKTQSDRWSRLCHEAGFCSKYLRPSSLSTCYCFHPGATVCCRGPWHDCVLLKSWIALCHIRVTTSVRA